MRMFYTPARLLGGGARPLCAVAAIAGLAGTVAVLSATGVGLQAQAPAGSQPVLTFSADIEPIVSRSCWGCHGSDQESGLDLRTRAGALEGGYSGPAVVPGRSDASPMYRHIAGLEQPAMPMNGELTQAEIATIGNWIDQGAHWDTEAGVTTGAPARVADANAGDAAAAAGASTYWAFIRPVQAPVPTFPELAGC